MDDPDLTEQFELDFWTLIDKAHKSGMSYEQIKACLQNNHMHWCQDLNLKSLAENYIKRREL